MHAEKNIRACHATLHSHTQRPFGVMLTVSGIVHISAYLAMMKMLCGSEGHTCRVAGTLQSLHCTFARTNDATNYG